MSYQCVSARFHFFNGKERFTVEYSYGTSTWFVFENEKATNALWNKKINPTKEKSPNRINAESILDEYLQPSKVLKEIWEGKHDNNS